MKKVLVSVLVLIFATSFGSKKAEADWKWSAVQITCDKDLNYFSLRTISFDDVKPRNQRAEKRVKKQSRIYSAWKLMAKPYTCVLPSFSLPPSSGYDRKFPARTIKVKVSHDNGTCKQATIVVNGQEVDRLPLNLGECGLLPARLIELDTFGVLTDCTLSINKTLSVSKTSSINKNLSINKIGASCMQTGLAVC